MQRTLSTYLHVNQPLTPVLLASIAQAGIEGIEIFCAASHFNYGAPDSVRELSGSLSRSGLALVALHAPVERDALGGRGSGMPISIADTERIRRVEAVDEMKRAMDVAERIPFLYFQLHLATGIQAADPRKLDAAFSSLEHLAVFAKHRGVTIALQNTANELGCPSALAQFLKDTHLGQLAFCFDVGHANIEGGVDDGFDKMRDRVVIAHLHDNHGERDEHLLPHQGTVDWDRALEALAGMAAPVPLVLELKETAPGTPSLEQARETFDEIEKTLDEKLAAAPRRAPLGPDAKAR
jgi:sugar phosphate isomerase/epimerase